MKLPAVLFLLSLMFVSGCSMKYTYPHEREGEPMSELDALSASGKDVGLKCERTTVVGSRLGRRVCSTQAQRDARREQARRDIEDSQRKAVMPTIQE